MTTKTTTTILYFVMYVCVFYYLKFLSLKINFLKYVLYFYLINFGFNFLKGKSTYTNKKFQKITQNLYSY